MAIMALYHRADCEPPGAAIHLVNQLPPSVCAGPPSVTLIHGWLARAELPLVIVACAASIISALSSRFPKEWQRQYLGRWVGPIDTWNGVGRVRGWKADQWCTSAYHGEVIVLAALSIATAYLDDKDRHPSHWSFTVGRGVFDNKQLNITVRCILNDLDHRLGHLCRPASIDCSLQAFKCAARLGVVPSGAIPARVRELPTRLPTPAQAAGPAALPTPEQRPSEPAAH